MEADIIDEPKDLEIKFGTEESQFWNMAKKNTLKEIKECERTILMDNFMLKLIEEKILDAEAE
jgi:hypothetical protein|tara:strand:- start:694 stop:882 length:189 start_codon:yes stop_codon:yes gene_type:complete